MLNRRRKSRGGAPQGGPAGRVVATVLVALAGALGASSCETNAQRSARLEKERLAHPVAVQRGLSVTRKSPDVKVVESAVLHDENGVAVVVRLRDTGARALRDAPIAITVSSASGAKLYQNNVPGLDSTLVSVPLLEPGREAVWVDDQIPATATAPAKASARVGEAPVTATPAAAVPLLGVSGMHTFADPSNGVGVEGMVTNRSKVPQQKLVVYVIGRRGGRIVAAGRAVLAEVPAGRGTAFQVFCIGSVRGARLEASAPPTAFD